jgi:hypothetical protein
VSILPCRHQALAPLQLLAAAVRAHWWIDASIHTHMWIATIDIVLATHPADTSQTYL